MTKTEGGTQNPCRGDLECNSDISPTDHGLVSADSLISGQQFPLRDVTDKSIQGELPWNPNSSSNTAASVAEDFRQKRKSSAAFRVVHSDKELFEKLGRKDPCPCGSGRRFQELLHENGPLRRIAP